MRTNRNGFTLLELLVVVTIVGILAAVAIPNLGGYIRRSRVSEGEAGLAAVRTAMRAKLVENGPTIGYSNITLGEVSDANIGINANDLDGRYFVTPNYTVTAVSALGTTPPTFTIRVEAGTNGGVAPRASQIPAGVFRTMNQDGTIFDQNGTALN